MNLVLIAEESAGVQTLRALASSGHRIVAVLTTSTSHSRRWSPVEAVARGLKIPVWPASLVREPSLAERLRKARVDLMLNIHSLHLVHEAVLDAPRLGAFNLHPGPLPERAGLNVPSWSIYLGEKTHGVTVHRITRRVDAGSIIYREDFEIAENDTGLSLSLRCTRVGVPLLLRLVNEACGRKPIPEIAQDLSRRRYFGKEMPAGGLLRWSQSARQVVDFVRACDFAPFPSPWPAPRTFLGDRELAILRASRTGEACHAAPGTVGEAEGPDVRVAAADEWVMVRNVQAQDRLWHPAELLRSGQFLHDEARSETLPPRTGTPVLQPSCA